MATCPRCKSKDSNEEKSWDVIPKTGKGAAMRVTAYKCDSCGVKFRKAVRLDTPRPAPETHAPQTAPVIGHVAALPEGAVESTQPTISSNPTNPNQVAEPIAPLQTQSDSLLHRLNVKFHL